MGFIALWEDEYRESGFIRPARSAPTSVPHSDLNCPGAPRGGGDNARRRDGTARPGPVCWNSSKLLGILNLSGTHSAYLVIVRQRKYGYALWIDTPTGSKFLGAARHAQRRRSLSRYCSTNLRICVWDRYSIGGDIRCAEATAGVGVFFVAFVFPLLA